MEKTKLVFQKPGGNISIDVVKLIFSYTGPKGKSGSIMLTNLIQTFVQVDDLGLLPDFVINRTKRIYVYEGRKYAEVDDVVYDYKYHLNNGVSVDANYIRAFLRIMEAKNNIMKPEITEKILKCLENG